MATLEIEESPKNLLKQPSLRFSPITRGTIGLNKNRPKFILLHS